MPRTAASRRRRPTNANRHISQAISLSDSGLTLDVIDELNSVASLLKCLPDLKRLETIASEPDLNRRPDDPIGWRLAHSEPNGNRQKSSRLDRERSVFEEVVGCADAVTAAAAWRLERLGLLLSESIPPR